MFFLCALVIYQDTHLACIHRSAAHTGAQGVLSNTLGISKMIKYTLKVTKTQVIQVT